MSRIVLRPKLATCRRSMRTCFPRNREIYHSHAQPTTHRHPVASHIIGGRTWWVAYLDKFDGERVRARDEVRIERCSR